MFNNARTYNQEGSWVYNDAEEMEKVFNATAHRVFTNSGLPGTGNVPMSMHQHQHQSSSLAGAMDYEAALTPMDDDERPAPPPRNRSGGTRKAIISDEEYMSDEDE